jgi:hypothetical protein
MAKMIKKLVSKGSNTINMIARLNHEHGGAGFTFCTNEEKALLMKYATEDEKKGLLPSIWWQEEEYWRNNNE